MMVMKKHLNVMSLYSRKYCLFSILLMLLVQPQTVSAEAFNIGVAASASMVTNDPLMNIRIEDLRSTIFDSMYASVSQITAFLNVPNVSPRTLVLPNLEGKMTALRPHSRNDATIARFYDEIDERYEEFLFEVCVVNDVRALLFIRADPPLILEAKNFAKDPNATLMLSLFAFYKDSGTMQMDFIDIDRTLMKDKKRLIAVIQSKSSELMRIVISNQARMIPIDKS